MPRYLIEVPHDNNQRSCDLAVKALKSTGSHFFTNAYLGCRDDVHIAWVHVEVDTREEALRVVPPTFRDKARAIRVDKLTLDKIYKYKKLHKD